ncbi:type III secretion protein [Vibrio mediterranei]|uniref:Type III secretion protein n=1 Tax=Vibrio mediterranei TaxID=689 RepID=A0A3G4VLI6_9VIBR|nr:type III secretion protein [Vibrio mediterranei]AYV25049.1 type III secretion protein [Vibrio mediterranei]MCG9790531.1 type III secretion protein [Vibrio mediterranei]
MKKLWCFLIVFLTGCNEQGLVEVASFESANIANQVLVLLDKRDLSAKLEKNKEGYLVYVDKSIEIKARELLTQFNFYFQSEGLNDLLESKFASLSKLELVKSNLLETREIYNKLSVIPNVLRVSVGVRGEKNKRVSVLIISLDEMDSSQKNNIERFLKGLVGEEDTLTISYLVQMANSNESV